MKTNLRKLAYWFVALIFAVTFIFVSCSKDEDISPVDENTVESVDFSDKVGGWIPLPRDVYEKIPLANDEMLKATESVKYLPCPSVGNQGSDGACVGWATAYAARSVMTGAQIYFSPAYVYNQIKLGNCSAGSYPVDALNLIKNQGVCTWSYMPYRQGDCYTQPNSSQRQNAANYRINGYYRVNTYYTYIRNQIAYGRPVVVAGRVDYAFQTLGYNRILTTVSGSGGGHAYCVVGYNDDYRCFLILNSWGTGWATNGYGWISYDIASRLWSEAYVMY